MPLAAIALKDINLADFENLDYYQRLGINPFIENMDEAVKRSYRIRAMLYHPDKNLTEKSKAEALFKAIVEAYETLSDVVKRQNYFVTIEQRLQRVSRVAFNSCYQEKINPGQLFEWPEI